MGKNQPKANTKQTQIKASAELEQPSKTPAKQSDIRQAPQLTTPKKAPPPAAKSQTKQKPPPKNGDPAKQAKPLSKETSRKLKIGAIVVAILSLVILVAVLAAGLRKKSQLENETAGGSNGSGGKGGTSGSGGISSSGGIPVQTPISSPSGTNNSGGSTTPGSPLSASAKLTLQNADWSQVLISQQPDLSYKPSSVYTAPDMITAIEKMVQYGVGSQKLWFGDGNDVYGLVSVAAFLAQSMKETIKYDACDENNWDQTSGYSAANACGQLGQDYSRYTCSGEDAGRECKVNPNKVIVATTSAKWYGAPGPFFAAPKSLVPMAPKWNYGSPWCNPADVHAAFSSDLDYVKAIAAFDGSATCRMYPGQKAGGWELCGGAACPNNAAPSFNTPARTDVEGCYFWGRGVIQTTGVCNYGKLNYYSGALAQSSGRAALFPDVDFCENPDQICKSQKYPELKWFSGLFYWLNAVQDYDDGTFNFKTQLKLFVDGGMQNAGSDTGFIHGVSGIVNRGCADPPNCGTGPLDGGPERAQNFATVLKAMKLLK